MLYFGLIIEMKNMMLMEMTEKGKSMLETLRNCGELELKDLKKIEREEVSCFLQKQKNRREQGSLKVMRRTGTTDSSIDHSKW